MSIIDSRMLCLTCSDKLGEARKSGMSMSSPMTDSSVCGSYKPILDDIGAFGRRRINKMDCLSCGATFRYPLILEDGLGSSVPVCPKCRSANLDLSYGLIDYRLRGGSS